MFGQDEVFWLIIIHGNIHIDLYQVGPEELSVATSSTRYVWPKPCTPLLPVLSANKISSLCQYLKHRESVNVLGREKLSEEIKKKKYHLSFNINLFIAYQNKLGYNEVVHCYYVTKTECQGCYKLPGPKSCDGRCEIIWLEVVQSEVKKRRNNSNLQPWTHLLPGRAGDERAVSGTSMLRAEPTTALKSSQLQIS